MAEKPRASQGSTIKSERSRAKKKRKNLIKRGERIFISVERTFCGLMFVKRREEDQPTSRGIDYFNIKIISPAREQEFDRSVCVPWWFFTLPDGWASE